jgi:hypothetical protein
VFDGTQLVNPLELLSRLKARWLDQTNLNRETKHIMLTIHKDVIRTDRTFSFYAASDETNVNLKSLFHILTTYCLSHPTVIYCQGLYLDFDVDKRI